MIWLFDQVPELTQTISALANSERYTEPGLHTNVDHLVWWEECRIGAGSAGLLTAQASWQKTPDLVPINEANVWLLSAIAYSDTRYGSVANGHLRSPSPRFARPTVFMQNAALAHIRPRESLARSGLRLAQAPYDAQQLLFPPRDMNSKDLRRSVQFPCRSPVGQDVSWHKFKHPSRRPFISSYIYSQSDGQPSF